MKNENPWECHSCNAASGEDHKDDCEYIATMSKYADEMIEAWKQTRAAQLSFRVVFLKRVHCCFSDDGSANDAWLSHEMTLPFAPAAMMIFTDREFPEWNTQAQEVQWDGEMFVVYTEPDREIYNAQANNRPGRDIAAIVCEYVAMNWTLLGYGLNPPIEVSDETDGTD